MIRKRVEAPGKKGVTGFSGDGQCDNLSSEDRNRLDKGEERETNKMQPIWCLLSNYLNMFRVSLCPSSGEQ